MQYIKMAIFLWDALMWIRWSRLDSPPFDAFHPHSHKAIYSLLLCSWDKSLNIGRCLLRILNKVHSFTFDCMNGLQQMVWCMKCIFTLSWDHCRNQYLTIWTICSKWEATPFIYWSLGKSPLFFLWYFGLSNFVSVIIRAQRGSRKRNYLEMFTVPLNKFPIYWFLHHMISWKFEDALHASNYLLQTVQTVKCNGVKFVQNSQQASSNIQALISTTL